MIGDKVNDLHLQYTKGGATRGHRNIILDQYLILFSRTFLPDDSKQLQDQICIGKFLRIFQCYVQAWS